MTTDGSEVQGLRIIEAKILASHVAELDKLCEAQGCSRTAALAAIVRGLVMGELDLVGVRISKRQKLLIAGRDRRRVSESREAAG
jgi:hypothetical protein